MKHRIKIKEWMAVRLYTWRLGWWKVKFWSGWSRRRFSLSFSLSARPSARGGADTCSLCLVSSMQKNIWCMKQTGEANLVSCLHIIISPRQLAPAPFKEKKKNQKKRKLPADSTASFVCVTSTCWHASGTVPFPRSSKIICVRIWEEIRHIIVRLCIMMPSAAPICARINILFMFKWHTLLNCHSVYLPFYRQVSSRSCSLASFVPHLFFLSQLKSVRQLCGLLFVGTSPVPPPLFRSELCFFFFCMCMFVCAWQRGKKSEMKEVSGVHKGKSDREREREGGWERLAMWVGLAVWVGVPVKLQIIN